MKKRLMVTKKESISSFIKIEDEYNVCLSKILAKNKLIAELIQLKPITEKQILFDKKILEEQIFDKALKSV